MADQITFTKIAEPSQQQPLTFTKRDAEPSAVLQSTAQAAAPFPSAGPGPSSPRAATLAELSVPGRDAIRDPLGNMTTDPTGLAGAAQGIAYLPAAIEQHRDLVKKMEQAGYTEEQIAEERKNNPAFNALFSVAAGPLASRGLGKVGEMLPGELPSGETLFPGSSTPPVPKAQRIVQKAFEKTVRGGETTALDVLNQLTEARLSGQPLTLSDIGGRPIRRLAGTVYRSGGEAGAEMEKFYTERGTGLTPDLLNTAAGTRIEKAIGDSIGTGSFKQATRNLVSERAVRARPLWDKAMTGGSALSLDQQFLSEMGSASLNEKEAVQGLSQARQALAGTGQPRSGSEMEKQRQNVKAAEFTLKEARQKLDDVRARLRQAQDDGTADAPGATWSPRIQEFLNLPVWKDGIRRGLVQERQDAVTEKRPFNPHDYSIIGEDKKGNPIIGAVPTMKLLQIAREGISAKIDDMRDPLTGGLSKAGRSLWRNLKEFEAEGYRLNPAWKEANDAWSRDSDSIRALQLGKKIFTIPYEDLVEDFNAMSESDKELFRLSAASKAVEDVQKTPLSADPSKRVINNPDELRRLRVLFQRPDRAGIESEAEFQKFVRNINRERIMFETSHDVMKGSQTAEREAADVSTAIDLAHAAGRLAEGRFLSAMTPLRRGLYGLGMFRAHPRETLDVAKLLTDPNLTVGISPATSRRHPANLQFGVEEMLRQAQGQ